MKKVVVLLVVVLAGLFVLRKTNLASYVSTAWNNVRNGAKKQVPLEFEVDRIRNEIAALDNDMKAQVTPIAEEMARVETLKQQIEDNRKSLTTARASILTMSRGLKTKSSDTTTVTVGDEEFTPEDVRVKLSRDFAAYKSQEAELKSQEKLLAAKEKSVSAVLKQLDGLKTLKRDLEVKLAQLEAELKTVRLAQTRDRYQFDDSRLSDIKNSLAEIEHRLKVERKVTELHQRFASEPTPVRKKVKTDEQLTQEVAKYFGDKSSADNEKVTLGKK